MQNAELSQADAPGSIPTGVVRTLMSLRSLGTLQRTIILCEVDDGDAGTAEADVFVGIAGDAGMGR